MSWLLGLLKFIPGYGTALTFLQAFKGPCAILAIASALLAGGLSGSAMWKLRGMIDAGKVAEARQELADFKTSLAEAKAELAERDRKIADLVLENRDEQKQQIGVVADAVRDLGRRVRLCASKSDVRVTVTPSGAIEAVPGGQLRDLAEAVREFAQSCASARDRDAVDHNALIDWLERVRK